MPPLQDEWKKHVFSSDLGTLGNGFLFPEEKKWDFSFLHHVDYQYLAQVKEKHLASELNFRVSREVY